MYVQMQAAAKRIGQIFPKAKEGAQAILNPSQDLNAARQVSIVLHACDKMNVS